LIDEEAYVLQHGVIAEGFENALKFEVVLAQDFARSPSARLASS
jgi:hypothetical protein